MKRALATIGAAAAATTVLAVPVSSASAWTWHHKYTTLHFPASPICQTASRPLQLHGTYSWVAFDDRIVETPAGDRTRSSQRPHPPARLHGRYRMKDCLWPARRNGQPAYKHVSQLVNVRTSGELISINYLTRSGFYHWGSKIRNIHGR